MALGRVLALGLLCHGVIAIPAGPTADPALSARAAPRKLHGRFLHITDFHPDEYYKAHSSTDEDGACHRGKGPAGPYGAETTDCDSPFSLVNATLDWIDANLKDSIDFVVWTGDSARHDRDEELPRSADQVLGTNTMLADKFAGLFAREDGKEGMAIPVVPNFGNNDILPHNILLPGPNKWLQHYAHIWRHFIPEEQRHSFQFGGWFHVEVVPNKLAVFSLNTLYFFDRNAGVDGCANPAEPGYKQMEWLRVQLQFLRERGMKAILMGHVPPARTESKMLWDETCWQRYSLWMRQYRDVVVAGLFGHMNIDHFLIHDEKEIDIAAMAGASSSEVGIREAMEDELSVQSASDYLLELRADWAKLTPPPASGKDDFRAEGKKGKGKKRKDPWGERYHLSFVGPSVVPNYFPTLRVYEYNITGLEDAPTWRDVAEGAVEGDTSQKHLELRDFTETEPEADAEFDIDADTDADADDFTPTKKKNKKSKNKKKKNRKDKKKGKPPVRDPNLHIPSPPTKSSPPGPAYSPQPLTLTGYTQYFANLTHINNLTLTLAPGLSASDPSSPPERNPSSSSLLATLTNWLIGSDLDTELESDSTPWLLRWRKGKHGGKKPAGSPQHPPQPREFAFEVEYSTFEDKIYRLGDLTVNNLVRLAVRMGAAGVDGLELGEVGGQTGDDREIDGEIDGEVDAEEDAGEEGSGQGSDDEESEDDESDGEDDDGEVEMEKKKKKGKGKKGKKGRKKKKHNKTWLHFLRHAFVGTLEEDELKKSF